MDYTQGTSKTLQECVSKIRKDTWDLTRDPIIAIYIESNKINEIYESHLKDFLAQKFQKYMMKFPESEKILKALYLEIFE